MKAALLVFSVLFSLSCFATPGRVLIIRHAEKPADDSAEDLSPEGFQRADALAQLFKIHPELAKPSLPSALFAARYVAGQDSKRCEETLAPLAKTLNLPVQNPYIKTQFAEMAQLILKSPELDGKTVMVAWTHTAIVDLAKALGSAPKDKWKSSVFDRIWELTYSANGKVTSRELAQDLMPGDASAEEISSDIHLEW